MTTWTEHTVTSTIGTRLHVAETGMGPALVLCDGLGCDGFIWKYLAPEFARTHRVIHWHYRGHGRSERPASLSDMTIEGIADDLHEVLRALDVRDAVLAGHSMGVQVILEAALRDAEGRIAGLVPMCGAPGRVLDTFKNSSVGRRVFPWVHALAESQSETFRAGWRMVLRSPVAATFARYAETNPSLVDMEDVVPYLRRLEASDPRVFLAMVAGTQAHDVTERLGEIRVPVLVVASERDTFTPLARSRELAAGVADAELVVLPDATHVGPLEWPEHVALRMRRFFRRRGVAHAA